MGSASCFSLVAASSMLAPGATWVGCNAECPRLQRRYNCVGGCAVIMARETATAVTWRER